MTADRAVDRRRRTLERYWSLFDVDDARIDDLIAEVFGPSAEFASTSLPAPLRGHGEIARHVRHIRATLREAVTRHVTDVQWVHDTARWCWRSTGPDGSHRGMDVVRLDPVSWRIESLVVFAGLLPPAS